MKRGRGRRERVEMGEFKKKGELEVKKTGRKEREENNGKEEVR